MPDPTRTDHRLADECAVLTAYLAGRPAPADVAASYVLAHQIGDAVPASRLRALDRAVMRVAVAGPSFARAADAFASIFVRAGALRRKLVLLVAILESRGESARQIDTATPGSSALWIAHVALLATSGIVRLLGGAVLIVPLSIWYTLRGSHAVPADASASDQS